MLEEAIAVSDKLDGPREYAGALYPSRLEGSLPGIGELHKGMGNRLSLISVMPLAVLTSVVTAWSWAMGARFTRMAVLVKSCPTASGGTVTVRVAGLKVKPVWVGVRMYVPCGNREKV